MQKVRYDKGKAMQLISSYYNKIVWLDDTKILYDDDEIVLFSMINSNDLYENSVLEIGFRKNKVVFSFHESSLDGENIQILNEKDFECLAEILKGLKECIIDETN